MSTGMIQIQIAGALSEDGVGDVRWVLLDASEAPDPPTPGTTPARADPAPTTMKPAAPAAAAAPAGMAVSPSARVAPSGAKERDEAHQAALAYQVLRAVVLVAALTAAWWTAATLLDGRGAPVVGAQSSGRTPP